MIIPEQQHMTPRKQQLIDLLEPREDIKSLVYVGARGMDDARARWWVKMCEANGIDWYMVEIFKPNCDKARQVIDPARVINADIMDTDAYPVSDCLIFWHGPEHINKHRFIYGLQSIEHKARRVVIFGMPLGELKQGAICGNPHEQHVSSWQPVEWRLLGYDVMTTGDDPGKGHITAWKGLADG